MKRAILLIAMLAASASHLELTAASGAFVPCPLAQARTEITSSIPSGWWVTPQLGSLQDVRVQTIGGQPTLVCAYWAYGTQAAVMRRFPEGMSSCAPQGAGFLCTAATAAFPTPYARPHSHGSSYSDSNNDSSKKDTALEEIRQKLSSKKNKYHKLLAR